MKVIFQRLPFRLQVDPYLSEVIYSQKMIQTAADKTTTKEKKTRAAKRAFVVSLFDLSWRLLGAMLVPIFAGLYVDSRQSGESQTFALTGFAIGMVSGAFVMRSVIRKISRSGGDLS